MEELKKCPFCGGEAKTKGKVKDGSYAIWCECVNCGSRTISFWPSMGDENLSLVNIEMCKSRAAENWNNRV